MAENPFPNPDAPAWIPGSDPRDAIRTIADTYDLSLADAARVQAGEANASVDREGIF